MVHVRRFVFNDFQMNTFVLYDETGECAVVDAGCHADYECEELAAFIARKNLKPVRILCTHCHIDHILGNGFMVDKFGVGLEIHKGGLYFLKSAKDTGLSFGFNMERVVEPIGFLEDGDVVKFGNSELRVVYTPGHADGSVCFVNDADKFVLTGDVLFYGSIGRYDLPTGDLNVLMDSIKNKLLVLGDDFTVFPGHGQRTSIGFERKNNPFL